MEPTDITGRILTDIRDEIRGSNARLDRAVARLDSNDRILLRIAEEIGNANGRLEHIDARVGSVEIEQRITNARLEALVDVVGRVVDQRGRVDTALDELRRRVERLERETG